MKRSFFLFAFLISVVMGMSQGLPLRFSAQYDNGSYHPFDTVKIENLTRGWTTFLVYPDTTIVLGSSPADGIDVASRSGKSGIKVYPNPFAGKTETVFQMAESGDVIISIIRIDGSVATEYHGHLASGGYRIGVSMSKPQVAFLCIETGGQRHVAKLVNCSDGGSDRIAIIGQVATSTRQTKDTDLDFEPGDMMRYMAVSMLGGHRTESEPMTQELTEGGDIILLFTDGDHPNDGAFDENGASYATFSIAADRQVRFSKGNLQYRASTGIWQFAENQYDYIGNENANISENYDGWIDLFGGGTSGWNSGANAYQPWSSSEDSDDYISDNSDNANTDWGVYNAISNGGNQPGMWRTLTHDEYEYLIYSRNNAVNKYGNASVNGIFGFVILPDSWTLPAGVSFTPGLNFSAAISNTYNLEEWGLMEYNGAIFFPAAGYRTGINIGDVNYGCSYWLITSDYDIQSAMYYDAYVEDVVYLFDWCPKFVGCSVRLVKDCDDNHTVPTVSTSSVTNIGISTATCGGSIDDDGGEPVIARGVCWSSEHNPTIADSHTSDGEGMGTFSSNISGLGPGITYYVRAYATNSVGTAYGNEQEFLSDGERLLGFDENGASYATFSVANGRQVSFSKGNLQYQASTGIWRFAENQYDCLQNNNSNISETYDGWIDLFGWGTSGWNSGANAYQPWSTINASTDYTPGGVSTNDLTGRYYNADWGVYNAISNGGNQPGMWRTLTNDEWTYLFYNRSNASSKYGSATVNGMSGLVILPDFWTMPDSLTFYPGMNGFENNIYTTEQWYQMEQYGALFLPAAGYRQNSTIESTDIPGNYWSSTHADIVSAYNLFFYDDYLDYGNRSRQLGLSVRLVRDSVEAGELATPTVTTTDVNDIGARYATCVGNVTDDGGVYVNVRGFCLSTTPNPTVDDRHSSNGSGTGVFSYTFDHLSIGTTYYVRAYAISNMGTSYGDEITFTTESNYVDNFDEDGASNAVFSIGENRQVRFSRGNLQYQASTDTWRFAEEQYDFVGSENRYISDTNSKWIDLFGWGTSGWNSGAVCYQPWSTSTTAANYVPCGDTASNLTGDCINADWGIYNAISNGGNQPGMWRTPSQAEWHYLAAVRENASAKHGSARVNNVCGVIVLPDNWTLPEGLTFNPSRGAYANNNYTLSEWNRMEAAGAIFLPAAGYRNGTSFYNPYAGIGISGYYWASTQIFGAMAYFLGIPYYECSYSVGACYYRYYGSSVRLIRTEKPEVSTFEVSNIQASTAEGGGNVLGYGSDTIMARGVCWSTTPNPTLNDSHSVDGFGLGGYSSIMRDLSPSTTYFVRAYATTMVGTSYGNEFTFTTADSELPSVTTAEISDITATSAVCSSTVSHDGFTDVTARGVCWSTSPNPTLEDSHTIDGTGMGDFVSNLNGLEPTTTYHVRAYATNSVGTCYGEDIIFTTACVILGGFDENGASNALFSVAVDRQVHFSKGNLQYQASSSTWRFAEHQYDFIGSSNSNISATYTGWIDLFGWGTSGWSGSGATYYQPYDYNSTTGYGPSGNGLTGDYANADWGVFNAISNGGNQVGMWRTLTDGEWWYLFEGREDASAKYGTATVDGKTGLVVLPDCWELPDNITFMAGCNGYASNTYTLDQWDEMESNGALFLPAAGYRKSQTFFNNLEEGDYWSSSSGSQQFNAAWQILFDGTYIVRYDISRYYGFSVRLVKD